MGDADIVLKFLKTLTAHHPLPPPSRPSAINILEMLDSENNNFVTVSLISHETYVNQLTLTLEYTDISLELECGYLIYQRL